MCLLGGCSGIHEADIYTLPVDPYRSVSEEEVRFGECTISFGDEVNVSGQGAWYEGSDILISEGGTYKISGSYNGGCIKVTTADAVKLIFSNADISNPDGSAIVSSAERLIIASDGENKLSGMSEDQGAVYSSGGLVILGIGNIDIYGGVYSRGGIRFGREVSTVCEIIRTDDGDVISGPLNIR
jgi:hypothetical protein